MLNFDRKSLPIDVPSAPRDVVVCCAHAATITLSAKTFRELNRPPVAEEVLVHVGPHIFVGEVVNAKTRVLYLKGVVNASVFADNPPLRFRRLYSVTFGREDDARVRPRKSKRSPKTHHDHTTCSSSCEQKDTP